MPGSPLPYLTALDHVSVSCSGTLISEAEGKRVRDFCSLLLGGWYCAVSREVEEEGAAGRGSEQLNVAPLPIPPDREARADKCQLTSGQSGHTILYCTEATHWHSQVGGAGKEKNGVVLSELLRMDRGWLGRVGGLACWRSSATAAGKADRKRGKFISLAPLWRGAQLLLGAQRTTQRCWIPSSF
jgi:hypothetical protein